jgi:hypothetical protein
VNVPAQAEEGLGILLSLYSQFLVMRQYGELDALSQRILRAAGRSEGRTRYSGRSVRQFLAHTNPILRRYGELLRAEKLGIRDREFSDTDARRVQQAYVEMIRELEARHLEPHEFLEWVPDRADRPDAH